MRAAPHIREVAMRIGSLAGTDGAKPREIVVTDRLAVEFFIERGEAARVEESLHGLVVVRDFRLEAISGTELAHRVDVRMSRIEDAGGSEAFREAGAGSE